MVTKKRWFSLKLCVDLCGGDTFTVLGRAHALTSRTLFTVSHHGRHNSQTILSNPPTPPGSCVASILPQHGIVFEPLHPRQLLTAVMIPPNHLLDPTAHLLLHGAYVPATAGAHAELLVYEYIYIYVLLSPEAERPSSR